MILEEIIKIINNDLDNKNHLSFSKVGTDKDGSLAFQSIVTFHIRNSIPENSIHPHYKINSLENAYTILNQVIFKEEESVIRKGVNDYVKKHNVDVSKDLYISVSLAS